MQLRVPLAQGFALGSPEPGDDRARSPRSATASATRYRPVVAEMPIASADRGRADAARARLRTAPCGVLFDRRPAPEYVALVDQHGRPSGIVRRCDHAPRRRPGPQPHARRRDMPLAAVSRARWPARRPPLRPARLLGRRRPLRRPRPHRARRRRARPAARRGDRSLACSEYRGGTNICSHQPGTETEAGEPGFEPASRSKVERAAAYTTPHRAARRVRGSTVA